MRNLYTRHAATLPDYARDAIASLFGRDALDSRVCDLMTLAEWEDIYDESAPRHADDCYTCGGDSPAYRADHEYARVCVAIGHRYCNTDRTCYGCGAYAPDPTPAPVTLDGQDSPPSLTSDAIEALAIILDVNDDDDIMIEAGVSAEGLAILREIAGTL